MTIDNYRGIFIDFMYSILGYPSQYAFYKKYKTSSVEVANFLSDRDSEIPLHWLEVIFHNITTPKEYAMLYYLTKKMYNDTCNELCVSSFPEESTSLEFPVQNEKESTSLEPPPTQNEDENFNDTSSNENDTSSVATAEIDDGTRFVAEVKIDSENDSNNKQSTFPSELTITKVLNRAFFRASCNTMHGLYSKETLLAVLIDSLPEVTIKITEEEVLFYDASGIKRDCFKIPQFIKLV